MNFAISLCTICALLICIVIATLFTGTFLVVNLSKLIAVMFIAAMFSLFLAMVSVTWVADALLYFGLAMTLVATAVYVRDGIAALRRPSSSA